VIVYQNESAVGNGAPRKSGRGILGITLLGVAIMLGQTFAANISIGTGGSLEFGQGIQATVACSGSTPITMRPKTSFVNVTGAGSMKFSSIEVSGIPSSCTGSKFIFTAYSETSTSALPIYDTSQSSAVVIMKTDNTFVSSLGSSGITVTTLSASSFKAEFVTPASNSTLVYRLTVESSSASCSDGASCALGDIGPGGGRIFLTPTSSGNTTGLYFEVAPANINGTFSQCLTEPFAIPGYIAIGTGETQTASLMALSNCNTSTNGAYAATNYRGGGQSDWFLPTKDEMKAVRDNAAGFYSNWTGQYMTSSQNDSRGMWIVDVTGTTCGGTGVCSAYKNSTAQAVRPIRTF
jgi:hypothetical protein